MAWGRGYEIGPCGRLFADRVGYPRVVVDTALRKNPPVALPGRYRIPKQESAAIPGYSYIRFGLCCDARTHYASYLRSGRGMRRPWNAARLPGEPTSGAQELNARGNARRVGVHADLHNCRTDAGSWPSSAWRPALPKGNFLEITIASVGTKKELARENKPCTLAPWRTGRLLCRYRP